MDGTPAFRNAHARLRAEAVFDEVSAPDSNEESSDISGS